MLARRQARSSVKNCAVALLGLVVFTAMADGATRLVFSEAAVRVRVSEAGRQAGAVSTDVRPTDRIVLPSPSAN
jgi:hypothetical protein